MPGGLRGSWETSTRWILCSLRFLIAFSLFLLLGFFPHLVLFLQFAIWALVALLSTVMTDDVLSRSLRFGF